MKFRIHDLVKVLELDEVPTRTQVPLALVGELENGCGFVACDCVLVLRDGDDDDDD